MPTSEVIAGMTEICKSGVQQISDKADRMHQIVSNPVDSTRRWWVLAIVVAAIHLLFADAARGRAFGIYGIVLGLAGAAGFMLGGALVTSDLAGLGWRAVFFVNVPFGAIIIAAAVKIMPTVPRRTGTRLDI